MRVIQIVQREATIFSIVGALVILAMFWIQARSLKFALLCMLPLLVGIVWTLGCLPHIGAKGLYLSFMNLVVLPILVGLGVAFGVHVVYNYRLYGSAERSLRVTLRPGPGQLRQRARRLGLAAARVDDRHARDRLARDRRHVLGDRGVDRRAARRPRGARPRRLDHPRSRSELKIRAQMSRFPCRRARPAADRQGKQTVTARYATCS